MTEQTNEKTSIVDNIPQEYIEKGQEILAAYKGLTLFGLSGQSTNEQALSRGHFGGKAAGIIALFILLQSLLNQIATIPPELVPVMKKIPKGIVWVHDEKEADQLGKDYGENIIQKGEWIVKGEEKVFIVAEGEKDRYYYDYKGYVTRDTDIAQFAYDVARATGSFQGETKQTISQALSNIKAVPIFPANMSMRPDPEHYTNIRENDDNV